MRYEYLYLQLKCVIIKLEMKFLNKMHIVVFHFIPSIFKKSTNIKR